jgi:hypothetical protein
MRTLRSWGVRFLSLFRKRRLEARLEEELRFHLGSKNKSESKSKE